MTRATWATEEQHKWLEARKAQFIEANQRKVAAKEFFPNVVKEFRENWPVPPVSVEEIQGAGSVERATKIRRDKYDKRVRGWFHNNTRNVASNRGAHGILKVKAKPKMLQLWQAYHALTYTKQWKSVIQEKWATYHKEWTSEHPNEKPAKTRFQIMVEFMKEKYDQETPEMKARCEEYRKSRRDESPAASANEDAERNREFQDAIEKLPRSLATMGESIMEQTGWHISILAGGPSPENGGAMMTYLSHIGKTKAGETFDKFLGKVEYNEYLIPFERFLHASFSPEDCASRSLSKGEPEVSDEEWNNGDEEEGQLATDGSAKIKENDVAGGDDAKDGDGIETGSKGQSDYERNKAKNIAELERELGQLNEQYPVPDELKRKPGPKKSSAKNKSKTRDEEVVRRESRRLNNSSIIPAVPVPVSSLAVRTDHQGGAQNSTDLTQELPPSAASPRDEIQPDETAALAFNSTSTSVANPDSVLGPVNLDSAETPSLADSGPALNSVGDSLGTSGDPAVDSAETPSLADSGPALNSIGDSPGTSGDPAERLVDSVLQPTDVGDSNVIMADDTNLPTFLTGMISYLRTVAVDRAWQDLVTNFVAFEKIGRPANGHLPTKSRPREVSDWIKSKKKDVVPFINPSVYGVRFTEWWGEMQPSWRLFQGADGPLNLVRDTSKAEAWQGLRKGGTAGIYVVVMGLSWWIKAQRNKRDANAWAAVDDLSWVIKQMSNASNSISSAVQKRGREDEGEGEDTEEQSAQKRSRL